MCSATSISERGQNRPAPGRLPGAAFAQKVKLWGSLAAGALVVIGLSLYAGVFSVDAGTLADGAGYLLLVSTAAFFLWLFFGGDWTVSERRRLIAIAIFFLAAAVFWSEFEQAGSTLNLFADRDTNNLIFGWSFPGSWYQSTHALFIIAFAPVFAWLWVRLGSREPSTPVKFSFGLIGVGGGFLIMMVAAMLAVNGVKVGPGWLIATYLVHTFAELSLSPVGLSAMTKLAPPGSRADDGRVFLGVGNFFAGRLASFYEGASAPNLFGVVGAVVSWRSLRAGRLVRRLMGEVH